MSSALSQTTPRVAAAACRQHRRAPKSAAPKYSYSYSCSYSLSHLQHSTPSNAATNGRRLVACGTFAPPFCGFRHRQSPAAAVPRASLALMASATAPAPSLVRDLSPGTRLAPDAAERRALRVTAEWLKANLASVKLLDGTWYMPNVDKSPVDDFLTERIPGSSLFLTDEVADRSSGLPHMLPSSEVFSSAVSAMGITEDTHVVVYDRIGVFSAPRVWWTFRVMGHTKVSVLDGGLPAWKAAGGETETSPVSEADKMNAGLVPKTGGGGAFQAIKDGAKVRSLQQIWDNVEAKVDQVVDARSSGRFYGTAPEPRPGMRGGHIPGSRSVPFDSVLREGMAGMKTPEEIRAVFEGAGVDLSSEKPLVASCGSGMTACVLALALDQIGQPLTSVYDGSWMEWGTNQEVPVVTEE